MLQGFSISNILLVFIILIMADVLTFSYTSVLKSSTDDDTDIANIGTNTDSSTILMVIMDFK